MAIQRTEEHSIWWCEAAAYNMGFARALARWQELVAPAGRIAVSEPVWLREDPPDSLRSFWSVYLRMTDMAGCRNLVAEAGYRLLGDFVLPEAAWWSYYQPIEERLSLLEAKYKGDSVAEGVLAEQREEIELYQQYSDYYGYGFFVMERTQ